MIEFHQRKLAGGTTLLVAPMAYMESACIGIWSLSGSRHESAGHNGLAHFTEHMLFKGTRSRDAAKIVREIEGVGGTVDAFTELDHTCYYAKAEASKLAGITEFIFDLYARPAFPAAEVTREREVIGEEIVMYYENPGQHVEDVLAAAAWPGNALGRPVTGPGESIEKLGRAELAGWVGRHHVAKNTLVTVAGRVDLEAVAAQLDPLVRELASGRRSVRRKFRPARGRRSPSIAVDPRPIEQAHVALGFRCPGSSWKHRFALRLLNVLLGENMSSRLFQCLRERHGLCYNIGSDITVTGEDGLFSIYAGVEPGDLNRSLDLIVKELRRIARRPPSRRELGAATDYATGMMKLSLEGTTERMLWLGDSFAAHGEIGDPEIACRHFAAVTPAEVSAAAATVFRPGLAALAVVGAVDDQRTLARSLAGLRS